MTKIEAIKHAISEANLFRSKLSPEALAVPSYTSLKIRHTLNNLGAISKNYLDCGSHRGGSYCSTVFMNDNLETGTCIDNFSEFNDGNPLKDLLDNAGKFKPDNTKFKLISKDCWTVKPEELPKIDLYLYDSEHSSEAQYRAVTHFLDAMTDGFIFVVDDFCWNGGYVKEATLKGIADSGLKVLFEQELWNGVEGDNFSYHNGLYVALLSKS